MPVHDWKSAPPGLLHHFHQSWTVALCAALNEGVLPSGFFALIEQKAVGVEPDAICRCRLKRPINEHGNLYRLL